MDESRKTEAKIGDLVRVRAHTRWSDRGSLISPTPIPANYEEDWGIGIIVDLYVADMSSATHYKVQFAQEHCWFENFELEVISES